MKFALALAACVSLGVAGEPRAAGRQGGDSATIFVAVTDKGGKPLSGLGAGDFAVTENGAARTVLAAAPAASPISVALLIDRFSQNPTFSMLAVRGALDVIVKTLHAANENTEISVFTIDPAAVPEIPFTESLVTVRTFIDKLAPGVEQAVLLEGIMAASKSMRRAKFPRRAMLALIAGYKVDASAVDGPALAAALRQSGASLWALEGRPSFGGGSPNSMRDAVLTQAVPASGGLFTSVGVGTALETQAKRLAETLASQYAVTYAAPSAAADTLSVTVGVKNAKVLAPRWISR